MAGSLAVPLLEEWTPRTFPSTRLLQVCSWETGPNVPGGGCHTPNQYAVDGIGLPFSYNWDPLCRSLTLCHTSRDRNLTTLAGNRAISPARLKTTPTHLTAKLRLVHSRNTPHGLNFLPAQP